MNCICEEDIRNNEDMNNFDKVKQAKPESRITLKQLKMAVSMLISNGCSLDTVINRVDVSYDENWPKNALIAKDRWITQIDIEMEDWSHVLVEPSGVLVDRGHE